MNLNSSLSDAGGAACTLAGAKVLGCGPTRTKAQDEIGAAPPSASLESNGVFEAIKSVKGWVVVIIPFSNCGVYTGPCIGLGALSSWRYESAHASADGP